MSTSQLRKLTVKEIYSQASHPKVVSILKQRLPVVITGVPGLKEKVHSLRELGAELPNMKGGFF